MTFTKLDQADLGSPRQELSNGGLGIVVALLILWHFFFVGSYWVSNPVVGEILEGESHLSCDYDWSSDESLRRKYEDSQVG